VPSITGVILIYWSGIIVLVVSKSSGYYECAETVCMVHFADDKKVFLSSAADIPHIIEIMNTLEMHLISVLIMINYNFFPNLAQPRSHHHTLLFYYGSFRLPQDFEFVFLSATLAMAH
jgi:hypothetical protein